MGVRRGFSVPLSTLYSKIDSQCAPSSRSASEYTARDIQYMESPSATTYSPTEAMFVDWAASGMRTAMMSIKLIVALGVRILRTSVFPSMD
jgi:hypothetical protein